MSEEDSVATRAASAFKTKGGLGVCFTVFGTSLLFINCHFSRKKFLFSQELFSYSSVTLTAVNYY